VVSEAKVFEIFFQGNPHPVCPEQKPDPVDADSALQRFARMRAVFQVRQNCTK
jgi:hypothetical protein